jgi:hypothetical protein
MTAKSIRAEVALIVLLIQIRIWFFDRMGLITGVATAIPIALVFFSWHKRGDNWETLGIAPRNWTKDLAEIISVFFVFLTCVILISIKWNPGAFNQPDLSWKFSKLALLYFPWALLQQLWCNGYFVNRLQMVFRSSKATTFFTGLLFGLVHLPNPVLFVATLLGGMMSAHFFQRNRNLYFLALAHAILAVSIKYLLPDAWHHNLRIGPGYWSWGN